jgi:hypothetical protein
VFDVVCVGDHVPRLRPVAAVAAERDGVLEALRHAPTDRVGVADGDAVDRVARTDRVDESLIVGEASRPADVAVTMSLIASTNR